jgi:Peptidase A4 family
MAGGALAEDKSVSSDEVDNETRDSLATKMIQNSHRYPLPPDGFNPLLASHAELRHYGIPTRPSRESHPLYRAKWEDILSRPLRVIEPILTVKKSYSRPPHRQSLRHDTTNTNATGWPWGGAVLPRPAGEFIDSVSASWTVPNAWPPASAWNGTNWNSGYWQCAVWVGIDGTGDAQNDVVQAGTTSEVTVSHGVSSLSS